MMRGIMAHLDGGLEEIGSGWTMGRPLRPLGVQRSGLFTNQLPDLTVAMPMDGGKAAMQVLTDSRTRL